MSEFSIEWLTLREGYDLRARNPAVLGAVASRLKSKNPVRVIDLACGTGSTLRALGPHLPASQHWDLVDRNPRLLRAACGGKISEDIRLNPIQFDLNGDHEAMLNRPSDLSTISALLDLVYRPGETAWVRAARERGHRAADGLEMLLEQGAHAFERWFGVAPDRTAMRAALASP